MSIQNRNFLNLWKIIKRFFILWKMTNNVFKEGEECKSPKIMKMMFEQKERKKEWNFNNTSF